MKITKVTLASLLLMSQLFPVSATATAEVSKPKTEKVLHTKIHKKNKVKKAKTVFVQPKRASRSTMRRVAQKYAIKLMHAEYKWSAKQFKCLNYIWENESHWQWDAKNKRSGALGIPQAYPGHKMKSAGKDYKTNYKTQIEWGLNYIEKRYGTPCGAYGFRKKHGYY